MHRLIIALAFILIAGTVDAYAQWCKKCDIDQNMCTICATTAYNAWSDCVITNNGGACSVNGECEGGLGEECTPSHCPGDQNGDLRERDEFPLSREYQPVAATVTRVERRRS